MLVKTLAGQQTAPRNRRLPASLAEILNQHDVAYNLVYTFVNYPLTIGGNVHGFGARDVGA